MTLELEQQVAQVTLKQLSLSGDGSLCAIGGGSDNPYFYLIDLVSKTQQKLTSKMMKHSYAPCFINGDNEYVALGSRYGQGVEVWDLKNKESLRKLDINSGCSSTSTNNILAFASEKGEVRMWDIRNWEMVKSVNFDGLCALSLHLTTDSKYLTIGGVGGDKCVVLEIK